MFGIEIVTALTNAVWNLERSVIAGLAEQEFDPDQVTSGPMGFAVIAVLAVAVIALCIPFVRTLRRISYRAQVQEEIAQELAERSSTVENKSATGKQSGDE